MSFLNAKMDMVIAIISGVVASLLMVLAIAVFEGYVPAHWALNMTYGEIGSLSVLFIVLAVAFGIVAEGQ